MMAEVPLTKKEMQVACKPHFKQTKIKMRKGFMKAPLVYKVPMTRMLSENQISEIKKVMLKAITPADCRQIAQKERSFWSYRDISLAKDFECGIFLYKGLAVALYFKRQVASIEPEPNDPVPLGALENADELWARLDLFTKSPRELFSEAASREGSLERQLAEMSVQCRSMEVLLAASKQENKSLRTQLENQTKKKKEK